MNKVWVLGAGFSASLGGPLLKNLFSPHSLHRIHTTYPKEEFAPLHSPLVTLSHWLYNWGTDFDFGTYPEFYGLTHKAPKNEGAGLRIWGDTEEFLEYLSLAQKEEGKQWEKLIETAFSWLGAAPGVKPLFEASRRLLTAECTLFTEHAMLASERWAPYVFWADELLRYGDTIVTFNYDPVVDILADRFSKKLHVVLPNQANQNAHQVKTFASCNKTALAYKLHGSTRWYMKSKNNTESLITRIEAQSSESAVQVDRKDEKPALKSDDVIPCIGMPGLGKLELTGSHLKALWEPAVAAIRDTPDVYLLGYRFPPTDSQARKEMIQAIGDSRGGKRKVTIVLGPHSTDTRRVETMVKLVCGENGKVQTLPVWVQDYFTSIVSRESME